MPKILAIPIPIKKFTPLTRPWSNKGINFKILDLIVIHSIDSPQDSIFKANEFPVQNFFHFCEVRFSSSHISFLEILFPEGTDLTLIKYILVNSFLIGTFLLILVHKKSFLKIKKQRALILFFFLSILIHTLLLSTEFHSSLERSVFTLSSVFLFYLFIHYKTIIFSIIYFVITIQTLLNIVVSDIMILINPNLLLSPFKGVYGNQNIIGFNLSIIVIPYLLNNLFIRYYSKKSLLSWELMVFLNGIALMILSGARAAMLTTIIVGVLFLFHYEKNKLKVLKLIIASFTFSILLIFTTDFGKKIIYKHEKVDNIFATREYLYLSRLNGIAQRPLKGWGFQVNPTHGKYIEFHSSNKLEKGNMYLALLEEFGLPMGIVLILSLISMAIASTNIPDKYYFVSGTIIGSLVHINFESWLLNFNSVNAFTFWFYVFSTTILIKINSSHQLKVVQNG